MDKKLFKGFEPGVRLLLVVLLIHALAAAVLFHWYAAVAEVVIFGAVYYYYAVTGRARKKDIMKYIENLSCDVDTLSQQSVLNFPMPMLLVRADGMISWYNALFTEILGPKGANYFQRPLWEVFPTVEMEKLLQESECRVGYEGRSFVLHGSVVARNEEERPELLAFYLTEETELIRMKQEVENHQSVVAVVMIDNYDEVILQASDVEKATLIASIDNRVGQWAKKYSGFLQRYQRDRYLLIMEMPYYKAMVKDKCSILDNIKEIVVGESKIPVTLSIGVGKGTYSFIEKYEYARAGIEIALGRGGDQVVVKSGDIYEYFGGKSKEMEKRTKVKSRVMATALRELIRGSDHVYIMGHHFVDLDALGAAVGVARIARNFGKSPRIFLDVRSQTIDRAVTELERCPEYEDTFVTVSGNLPIITDKTLLVVVDTHSSKFVEWPELLRACTKVVVIDHHRRGEYFIDNATLMFHEPYASSASEMVTEVAGYLDKEGKLTRDEANILLAGIILDTKGFTLKTGVRTFEAASALRRLGADTVEAKRYFQNTLEEYKRKASFISTAEFFDNIAICVSENEGNTLTRELFAQCIDDLMSVEGIDASFGIARFGDQVHVSGRSYGKINVQVIVERLGGGGHQTMAGAQLSGKTVGQVKVMLLGAIYHNESIDNIGEETTHESHSVGRRKG
ncbi:MAG: DHH family phosphoesterase [Eubacteriales bacterium]|jgi:c-di-AMP phosphodiesterase-like protein